MSRVSTVVPIPLRAVTRRVYVPGPAKAPASVRPFHVQVWAPAPRLRFVQIVRTSVVRQYTAALTVAVRASRNDIRAVAASASPSFG